MEFIYYAGNENILIFQIFDASGSPVKLGEIFGENEQHHYFYTNFLTKNKYVYHQVRQILRDKIY